jgi:hypothetical protein
MVSEKDTLPPGPSYAERDPDDVTCQYAINWEEVKTFEDLKSILADVGWEFSMRKSDFKKKENKHHLDS